MGVALIIGLLMHSAAWARQPDLAESHPVLELHLEGIHAIDESEVRAVLQTRVRSWWPWRASPPFDPAVFEADLERIVALYADRGYPAARAEGLVQPHADGMALRIRVTEGEPIRASDVTFIGFDVLTPGALMTLRQAAALEPGRIVTRAAVQQTIALASTALWNAAHSDAVVQVLQTEVAPSAVRLDVRAAPGDPGFFGPIEIAGHLSVDDPVIRRQLAYRPGEPFQVAALQETERRLSVLGLFESVEITWGSRTPGTSQIPTRVTVRERDFTELTYSFGYGSEEHLYGEAQLRQLNVLGGGRTALLRGRWSWLDRGGESAFIEPYFFTSALALEVRGYAWHLDDAPYDVLSAGGRATLRYRAGPNAVLAGRYIRELERIRLPRSVRANAAARDDVATLGLDPLNGEQRGLLLAAQLEATYTRTVEAPATPRGFLASVRLDYGGRWLGGAFNYRGVLGDLRAYRPLAGATLAWRMQYGSIAPAGAPADVPFSKRHFLGGADTLRGWGRLEVSPRSASGLPVGGLSSFVTSGEIRIPLNERIGVVPFVDAGNVWEDPWQWLLRDLHANVGAGLRVVSPLGLLRLDIAHQLTTLEGPLLPREPQERRWRVHFSAGHAF